jgi:hypothetical protein
MNLLLLTFINGGLIYKYMHLKPMLNDILAILNIVKYDLFLSHV